MCPWGTLLKKEGANDKIGFISLLVSISEKKPSLHFYKLKKVGAGFLVTLIEGANEMLSNELNIVVCTSFFKLKKLLFVNL